MEIAVDGSRAGATDWDAVRNLPVDKLPALTREQREVAQKLGIPEADYARSALAGERSREMLLAKTERLARLLSRMLQSMDVAASVESVTLRTFHERFDVLLKAGSDVIPVRIAEQVVDDLFEAGSAEAEERLGRIMKTAVQDRVLKLMRLSEREVTLILSPEGRQVMQLSHVNLPETAAFWVKIEDTNDIGLWVRAPREDGDHLLLIRWEYVLSVDFPAGETRRAVGLQV